MWVSGGIIDEVERVDLFNEAKNQKSIGGGPCGRVENLFAREN